MVAKIKVRTDLCAGMGLCVLAAPNVFKLDENGYNMTDGWAVPEGFHDEARHGASVCPEGAIEIIEEAGNSAT